MSTKYFDSHAHYDDERFSTDREALLDELLSGEISHIINAATDLESSEKLSAISALHPNIYHSVGVHPHEAAGVTEGYLDGLYDLYSHTRAVAIGEIGLDFHYDFAPRDIQRKVFAEQLALAERLAAPVIIHDREAHNECMNAVLSAKNIKCVFHSFSGSAESAVILNKAETYLSFNGIVTFKNAEKTRLSVAACDENFLLVETDCPYLSPSPKRGARNDSANLKYIVSAIAVIKNKSEDYIAQLTSENAKRFFNIDA